MVYGGEKKDKLERLEKKLYSRKESPIIDGGRSDFIQDEKEVNEDWQNLKNNEFDEVAAKVSKMARNKHSFIKKIFIASIWFFFLAVAASIFVFWRGGNLVSSKNVDIEVFGPLSIPGGQEVSFEVNIVNNNNVDLESASLVLQYPIGTRSAIDLTRELNEERYPLERIKAGESHRETIKAVFFGEKEDVKEIKISIEYRVENSSALFYKDKTHQISISSSPLIITATYPKEINSNQEIIFNLELASNSKEKLGNFLVKVEYPFGFSFVESSPKTSFGDNLWYFETLNFGEKKTISIKGIMVGQNNEERVFKISAGTADLNDDRTIAVPIVEMVESVLIKKPFIGIDVDINGRNSDYIGEAGRAVNTTFVLKNNLPEKIFNASLKVGLKGGAFDKSSVSPNGDGFFQSLDDTIFWDKRSISGLSEISPETGVSMSFRLAPLSYSQIKKGSKPEIEMIIEASGERILESGSVEKVFASETRKILLGTTVELVSKAVRSAGDIENSGPIPPKVDMPTTYTVVWAIKNTFNQVSNIQVRATLPPYIKWTGIHKPSSEIIYFNEADNEIVWNAGSILPNTGFGGSSKEVYFQVEFLPSLSQVNQVPIIVGRASLVGNDKVTGLKIEEESLPVTTNFSGDPDYKSGDDKVVQ